ncbi:vascular endothelial growth factor receptor 1 isoform X6 [Drosophila serrata]|uniref:vascular endothelial growth factor receptor 1 isoform X6 n=1 Tax=Drosophila serrata TaxID=7274 RepID=UPI000A1D2486|nr:vascular endothelial growth factor receptor 1 isoform X6 [Drosophila serrata]
MLLKRMPRNLWPILLLLGISWIEALPRPQYDPEDDPPISCGGENGAPLITPCKDNIKLEYRTNYTLLCEAGEPVIWWINSEVHPSLTTFTNDLDPTRPYGVRLDLLEVTADQVGAYFCIKESSLDQINLSQESDEEVREMVNQDQASSIYVYVNDPFNKLVPTEVIVIAHQYSDVVIPCKPAMPETEVLLHFNGDRYSSREVGRYDPKRGFTIEIRSITDGGEYSCLPKTPYPEHDDENWTVVVSFIGNGYIDKADKPLPKPEIKSRARNHVFLHGNFTLVCEQSSTIELLSYSMEWITPPRDKSRVTITTAQFDDKFKNSTHHLGRSTLTVTNAQPTDTGLYKCVVTEANNNKPQIVSYKIKVLAPNETYLNVNEPSNHYDVREFANKTIQMTATFEGFPEPSFSWLKPDGTEVWQTEHNFKIISTERSTTLQVLNAQLEDSGTYILRGTNTIQTVERPYNVSVIDGPALSMPDVYVQVGSVARLECTVRAYPPAIVTFFFRPCSLDPRWPTCSVLNQNFSSPNIQEQYQFQTNPRPGKLSIERVIEVSFRPTEPGILTCIAQNLVDGKERRSLTKAHVLLGDIAENMTIYGLDEQRKIAKGDEENFTCEALAYHFDDNLRWLHNGVELEADERVTIENSKTEYSYKSTVRFSSIMDEDRGTYECRAYHIMNSADYASREINVFVHDPRAPQWKYTNLNTHSKMERNLSQSLELVCRSEAVPLATVRWFKDGRELVETNLLHFPEGDTKLLITHLYPGDEGVYRCLVENRLGSIENSITVVLSNLPGISKGWIWFGVMLFLLLISLCAFLAVRYHKEHKRHLALKAAGLANFEEGAVGHINPDLTLDEQAELLPYNREFEFPRDNLKLGKQLGAGAFGVVLKGEAKGIRKEEPTTTVAVKMVKRTADNEVMRALVSELKIMVHLGQHLNVVNLLGAVTKNIAKRELMVIVEYCRFGNIQNFLLRNRKCFINQISPETDHIDPNIMTQRFSENFDLHRNSDNDPRSGTRAGRPGSGSATYSYDRQMDTCNTVMTTVPEDDQIMSNNSVQPAWRSNYKTDSTEAMSVTTVDLVSWAFQVARGMDYLSSKKVLHGDLAARNILLCEDNVVKICDFGLARSMYRGDNYKKSESGKLPIKWLALESLSDHVFSTYSDVWSFGIVLWEMFSLAKVPYPGIDPNQELFNKLNDGYRMEKPPYANQELYDIMLECWRKNPESRPLFNELEKRFATMLGEDVANHYLDLNNPYLQSNMEYMKNQQTDYLALMGSPDELAPSAPRYVNGHIVPDIRARQSPTLSNNMNISGASKPLRNKKNGLPTLDAADQAPEEIPMLHRRSTGSDEDEEGERRSPEQARRFNQALKQHYATPTPSPRHHVETKLNGESSAENYVNVKPPRKNLPNKASAATGGAPTEAFSNPSYQPLSAVNEKEQRRY